MSIFKQCDIRGVYGQDLDTSIARALGMAIGERSTGQAVVVGGDLRISTPALKEALIDGLVYGGAQVLDVGTLPTPSLYYAKRHLEAWGSVMVTASHNPPRYNGFKLMLGADPITPGDLRAIESEMRRPAAAGRLGSLTSSDILPAYREMLAEAFPVLHPRRIVVDAGNGSMSELAPQVLGDMGMDVVPLYCEPDGRFPHRDPNPAVPEHLNALREMVVSSGAEMGVAYDGDGDRVIWVDGRGHVLPADRAFVLLIRQALAQHPGAAIVYDLKSSSVVAEETERLGGRPLMERSGHAFIKRRLMDEDAALGGEVSGHCFFGAIEGDDALYATLAMLQALDDADMPLSGAIDSVPAYPISPDLRLPCPPEKAQSILDTLKAQFYQRPIASIDGVRIDFGDGWALARLSVTEPLITLRFEAHDEARLRQIMGVVLDASPALRELAEKEGIIQAD